MSSDLLLPAMTANQDAMSPASRGSPEGRFLAGPGKSAYRHLNDLKGRETDMTAKAKESETAVEHAESTNTQRTRSWPRRSRPTWQWRP